MQCKCHVNSCFASCIFFFLGNNDLKSVYVFSIDPGRIVHVSDNITFINIFNPQLAEFRNADSAADMEADCVSIHWTLIRP